MATVITDRDVVRPPTEDLWRTIPEEHRRTDEIKGSLVPDSELAGASVASLPEFTGELVSSREHATTISSDRQTRERKQQPQRVREVMTLRRQLEQANMVIRGLQRANGIMRRQFELLEAKRKLAEAEKE